MLNQHNPDTAKVWKHETTQNPLSQNENTKQPITHNTKKKAEKTNRRAQKRKKNKTQMSITSDLTEKDLLASEEGLVLVFPIREGRPVKKPYFFSVFQEAKTGGEVSG